ncbi:dihydrodipicolinate synthase family protein [Aureibaculum conchae]|uniref:dihydrodipicolinate synthase family protein n=1 Tax=Aureibaculum sp. 2308TA14-22 TaxID=3108392 RepID=UPI0033935AA3
MQIKNLIAATYAPMNKDQSLNLEVIASYKAFLKNNSIAGAFVNGSTGDFVSLTVQERKLIVEEWSKYRSDDFTLINHVGHTSLKVAKELTEHSSDKVDAIAALAPFYFKPKTLQSLVFYCEEIAKEAPHLPFYYYHIPVLTGVDFDMVEFLQLVEKLIPNFAGIKFTEDNLQAYQNCANYNNGKYNILFGVDEKNYESRAFEAKGWVGSTYNHLAPLYYKISELVASNKHSKAKELQKKAVRFVTLLDSYGGFNGVAKGFMKTLGIDCGPSRYPHTTLTDTDYVGIQKELDAIGFDDLFSKNSELITPNSKI